MKPLHGVTISAADMEFVYQAVLTYTADLDKYGSWLKSREGRPLPGAEVAVAEVAKEVARYRELSLHLYKQCFVTSAPPPTGGNVEGEKG